MINKRDLQLTIMLAAMVGSFFNLFILQILLGICIIFGLIHIAAIWRNAEEILSRTSAILHWILEGVSHTWALVLAVTVHTWIPIKGRRIRLGWPLAMLCLLAYFGNISYRYFTSEPVVTADSATLGTLPFPIGVDRVKMTPEQLDMRAGRMVITRQFYLLRENGAVEGAKKVIGPIYKEAISGASRKYGIESEILEAHVFLESQGSEQAKSPTGPKGPGQFTALTAANLWDVKDGKYLLRYKGQEKDVAANRRRKRHIRPDEIIEDNREDPVLAVYAEAKLLREERDFFGRQDFASAAYHSSRDKIREWVKMYLAPLPVVNGGKVDIEKYNLTYDKLYFGATPYKNPGTYKMFRDLMAVDFGANYWYKILCARDVLSLLRKSPLAFEALAQKQRYNGQRAANRMWTFYGPDDEKLVTLDDLRAKLEGGELVTIPDDPRFGFKLRLEGSDSIGALDKENREYYIATKKETAGALLFIAQEVSKLRAGRKTLPLEVTSVTRTVDYQEKLTKVNPVATKKAVSFHVLGLAFDITKNGMSLDDQRDIQFILDELDSTGFISWVPENAAYHVVVAPSPEAIAFFQKVFDATGTFRLPSPLAVP